MTSNPAFVAPDRALVFEVIGPVTNFIAAARSLGLEWLAEEFDLKDGVPSDEEDETEGEDDEGLEPDQVVTTLYVTMPTLEGLKRLVALWRRYIRGDPKPGDAKEWWTLFGYLSDLRGWSIKDRIDPRLSAFIDRSMHLRPDRPVRLELDLWYRDNPDLRASAEDYVQALMAEIGGRVLDFATIDPIHYQAALVEMPGSQAVMLRYYEGPVASAQPVMRIRPQSLFAAPHGSVNDLPSTERVLTDLPDQRQPIAALLDGYPVQNHALLAGRVDVEEVEVTGTDVPVSRRFHGTAMASLILHGDLAAPPQPLQRTLKVVPILAAPQGLSEECTPQDKLPLAMVYRAVKALKEGSASSPPTGESIVVVNHSVCDMEAPFAGRPSAWAKLIDYLSHEHQLLFVISAGNIHEAFPLAMYSDCAEFSQADSIQRQAAILLGAERAKGLRSILSPAEAMNALTVGAVHEDWSGEPGPGVIEPYDALGMPNLCSAVGLGINRAIKPDLLEAGGRQIVETETQDGVVSVWGSEGSEVGQLVASPDLFGGATDKVRHSTGTSNSAALVTRSAVRLADVVESIFTATGEDWLASPTRAVVLKALIAHGCEWGDVGTLLNEIYPPSDKGKWRRRRLSVTRAIGYGRADPDRIISPTGNRITLLADDVIGHDQSHQYHIPIPRGMLNNKELRRVVMTLAWSSPIDPWANRYRGIHVDLVDATGKRKFWSGVKSAGTLQPHPDDTRKGALQHFVLEGENMVRSVQSGHFVIGVQARAAMKQFERQTVPYAMAVTLEVGQAVAQDIYIDVAQRVRLRTALEVRQPVRDRIRTV